MKAFPKVGLLVLVALLATAAVATSAQAVTINPDNAAVHGQASNSNLTYGVAFVSCDNATADGNTGLNSDRITNLALQFDTNCAVAGVGPATVSCSGTATLIAQHDTPIGGTGAVNLNTGFQCVVTTAVCSITVSGPQTTQNDNVTLDEANQVLSANVGVQATRTGLAACGPASGTATFAADYDVTNDSNPPVGVTIDP
jgi:hypothetical protein